MLFWALCRGAWLFRCFLQHLPARFVPNACGGHHGACTLAIFRVSTLTFANISQFRCRSVTDSISFVTYNIFEQ
jgi:hypothetical protein